MKNKLVLTGDRNYLAYMKEHLPKEHPKTKNHIRLLLKGGRKK